MVAFEKYRERWTAIDKLQRGKERGWERNSTDIYMDVSWVGEMHSPAQQKQPNSRNVVSLLSYLKPLD